MRILAVVYCYPPMRVPASLCYLKLVLGMRELGHDVDLVRIHPESFEGGTSSIIDPNLTAVCPGGIREYRVWSPEAHLIIRGIKRFGLSYQLFHRVLEPRKREWSYAARWALRKVKWSDYDVVLSCSQPHANHVVGRWIRRKSGIPWVAYFSDPWVGNPYARKQSRRIQDWNAREEAGVLVEADRVLFTCEEMERSVARRFPPEISAKFGVLPHCYVSGWYGPQEPNDRTGKSEGFRFLHTGHFYGPRSPMSLFRAIRALKEAGQLGSQVRFEFYGSMRDEYKAYVQQAGLDDVIVIHDSVGYLESLRLMSRSDCLLVIDADVSDSEESIFLPSKLIDYFGSGRPILGVTPLRGATARFLRQTGHPVCSIGDERAIVSAIIAAINRPKNQTRIEDRTGYDHLSVAEKCAGYLQDALRRRDHGGEGGDHRASNGNAGVSTPVMQWKSG